MLVGERRVNTILCTVCLSRQEFIKVREVGC